jgi:hypothetical protein
MKIVIGDSVITAPVMVGIGSNSISPLAKKRVVVVKRHDLRRTAVAGVDVEAARA